MSERIRFIKLPIVLLILVFIGRVAMGASGASYETANRVFSMVILQVHLALLWGAFGRRYMNYGIGQAILTGVLIGLVSQTLIIIGTAGSYVAGTTTFFNLPEALNQPEAVPFGQAMLIRIGGLVVNSIIAGVVASLGWALGSLIPARGR